MSKQEFLSRSEAADYCRERGFPVAKSTLQKYASLGGGPVYRRFGTRALYTAGDLETWIHDKLSDPLTSTSKDCG